MTLVETLKDPRLRREYELGAHSFLDAGIAEFTRERYRNAKQFFDIAGRIFYNLGDEFYRGLVKPWYVATVKKSFEAGTRNSGSHHAQQLPVWCH